MGHASNILPVVKVVRWGSLFPWYPSSLRTVNCTDSICKLIDHYHVLKNNCSLTAIMTEGFGEPLAFYVHTHPLTVLPHWRNSLKRGKGEGSTLVSFRPFRSGPSAWEGRSQATAWWLGGGGWTGVTSADRTLGPHEGSGLRSEHLGQKLWPKTGGPWSCSLSDIFLLYDSLWHTVVSYGILSHIFVKSGYDETQSRSSWLIPFPSFKSLILV